MAKRQITQLVDDLDGTVLESGVTVLFSLEGQAYEIDLSEANAQQLREALAPFIAAGRSVGGARSGGTARRRSGGSNRVDLAAVREWARENGREVSDRGRVPASVLEAYAAR